MIVLELEEKTNEMVEVVLNILRFAGFENLDPFFDKERCEIKFSGMDELVAAQDKLKRYKIHSHIKGELACAL